MDAFPPNVPSTLRELNLAIMLLGNLGQNGSLKPPKRAELRRLLGAVPSRPYVLAWKRALKDLREDVAALEPGAA